MYLKSVLRRLDQTGHTVVDIQDIDHGVNIILAGGVKVTFYKTGSVVINGQASDHLRYVLDRMQFPERYMRKRE